VGWSGLVKKSRCQDKNAVSSRHNSKNNPPCLRSWCYLNLSSSTRRGTKFGEDMSTQLTLVQDYKIHS
ncbi:hypothetical protein AVEN_208775-1, partial [Araneus ventricosus]